MAESATLRASSLLLTTASKRHIRVDVEVSECETKFYLVEVNTTTQQEVTLETVHSLLDLRDTNTIAAMLAYQQCLQRVEEILKNTYDVPDVGDVLTRLMRNVRGGRRKRPGKVRRHASLMAERLHQRVDCVSRVKQGSFSSFSADF